MKKFFQTLGKTIAIALVFGLVSGLMFQATTYFLGGTSVTTQAAGIWQRMIGNPDAYADRNADVEANLNIDGEDDTDADESKSNAGNSSDETMTDGDSTSASDENAAFEGQEENNSTSQKNIITTDISDVVRNVMPSIVAITNVSVTEYQTFFGSSSYESESCGSGFIVAQNEDFIYIATNNHVINGTKSLTVEFCDDATASAQIQGTNETRDLAVIRVSISDMEKATLDAIKVASIGDSDALRVGQSAIAIGNALGYGQSVTTGVISALNREVTVQDNTTGQVVTNNCIQTDAAINPGNSGGALLNIKGEVIGINEVKYSRSRVEGIGYAIPMAAAKPIIDQMIDGGETDDKNSEKSGIEVAAGNAYLGIYGLDVDDALSQSYHMPGGVYVARVAENSPAKRAGIKEGDVITVFDGVLVGTKEELEKVLSKCSAGDTVTVILERTGDGRYGEYQINVTLSKRDKEKI